MREILRTKFRAARHSIKGIDANTIDLMIIPAARNSANPKTASQDLSSPVGTGISVYLYWYLYLLAFASFVFTSIGI